VLFVVTNETLSSTGDVSVLSPKQTTHCFGFVISLSDVCRVEDAMGRIYFEGKECPY